MQWQGANLAIEFEYDESFEYEQQIKLKDLSPSKQAYVLAQKGDATKMIVEEVFSINGHSYEAYFYSKNGLVKKIDFS